MPLPGSERRKVKPKCVNFYENRFAVLLDHLLDQVGIHMATSFVRIVLIWHRATHRSLHRRQWHIILWRHVTVAFTVAVVCQLSSMVTQARQRQHLSRRLPATLWHWPAVLVLCHRKLMTRRTSLGDGLVLSDYVLYMCTVSLKKKQIFWHNVTETSHLWIISGRDDR